MSSSSTAASTPFIFPQTKQQLAHRLVMAPMTRRRCGPNGIPTDDVAKYYCARSLVDNYYHRKNPEEQEEKCEEKEHLGFSMIITEGVFINNKVDLAGTSPTIPHIGNDEAVAAWKKVMSKVKGSSQSNNSNNVTIMQLWHTGRFAGVTSPGARSVGPVESEIDIPAPPPSSTNSTTYSTTAPHNNNNKMKVDALTQEEIQILVQDYAKAAHNAVHNCGFQGVEPHFAHGYLIDSFLSPTHNTRTDEFGGSDNIENRLRFPCMILKAIRDAIGPNALLIPRISQWSVSDYEEKKFKTSADLEITLKKFIEAGRIDAIHISTRRVTDVGFPDEHPTRTLAGWATYLLKKNDLKQNNNSSCAVIGVGSVCVSRNFAGRDEYRANGDEFCVADPTSALKLIEDGEIDLLAVGRAGIADPNFCGKVLSGNWKDVRCYKPAVLAEFP